MTTPTPTPVGATVKTITVNGVTYACPYLDVMPPLSADERAELKADIAANGVTYPVLVTDDREVIDGHNRLEIAAELGLANVPVAMVAGLSADQKRARAEDLNLHRRHLTRDQKREIIARRLKADPGRSNNAIAAEVRADDKTVRDVRRRLEATSEIPKLAATRGRDGRTRPATRGASDTRPPSVEAIARRFREQEQEAAVAARITAGIPTDEPAKWAELKYVARRLHDRANDLGRAGKTKVAGRDVRVVRNLTTRLQAVVDELRRWADRYEAGAVPTVPTAEGGPK